MAEQFGEKTHDATPYRRQKAREDGNVAKSQDLASAAMLLGALLVLRYVGPGLVNYIARLSHEQLGQPWVFSADRDWAVHVWYKTLSELGSVLLPILALIALLAAASHIFQVGFLFVPKKVGFDASRISLFKGVQRIFSPASAVRLALGIFKVLVVAAVALWSIWGERDNILLLTSVSVPEIALFLIDITLWTSIKIGVALFILAIFDYIYQKWKFEQDLKMTTQEVKEEMKTLQGDPQVVARRRQVQRQLALNRMTDSIPSADVVVTNPTELAIALKYDPEQMPAPMVVAKGAGLVAQRIRRLALENNIPVVERKELARVLYKQTEIGEQVPIEQYAAVAEVLKYVYDLKGETPPALRAA